MSLDRLTPYSVNGSLLVQRFIGFDVFRQLDGYLNVRIARHILIAEPRGSNAKRGVIFARRVLENHFRAW